MFDWIDFCLRIDAFSRLFWLLKVVMFEKKYFKIINAIMTMSKYIDLNVLSFKACRRYCEIKMI